MENIKDNLKNWEEGLRKNLLGLHDKYHPEAVFVTQTSGTNYGWMIRKLWKTAWPEEKALKVFTINVKPIRYTKNYPELFQNPISPQVKQIEEEVKSKITRHGIRGNIAVLDDNRPYLTNKKVYYSYQKEIEFEPQTSLEEDNSSDYKPKTLGIAREILIRAIRDLGYKSKVAAIGMDSDHSGEDYEYGRDLNKGVWRYEWDSGRKKIKTGRVLRVNKHQKEEARKTIEKYKNLGMKIGEQIRESREREKSEGVLERIIGRFFPAVSIIFLLGSILFLSTNLTGNVIGNLTQTSSNIVGVVLFAIGIVGAFLYFRRR